jgi:hypothetical protein
VQGVFLYVGKLLAVVLGDFLFSGMLPAVLLCTLEAKTMISRYNSLAIFDSGIF